ncbi:hypothetical protein Ddye_014490 [Dipteronia dyeriana]|uniref:Uncharacterized protein n=1 Tax=Dipteronia dyeriana TaxID=168575 RepID=A0AAD9X860_9ROSI|nr:hypothetical protein Ddye_014490 [Dipteronia dyeriana]
MGQIHQNMARPSSKSKHKRTLHKGRSTTIIDMMQFVSDWFDSEESENDPCIVSEGGVANYEISVQMWVEIEENDDQFESSIFENLTQQMVETIGFEVFDETHVEPINLFVEEIDKTTESNIF